MGGNQAQPHLYILENTCQLFVNLKCISIVYDQIFAPTYSARACVEAVCKLNSLIIDQTGSGLSAFFPPQSQLDKSKHADPKLEIDPRHGQKVEQEGCEQTVNTDSIE